MNIVATIELTPTPFDEWLALQDAIKQDQYLWDVERFDMAQVDANQSELDGTIRRKDLHFEPRGDDVMRFRVTWEITGSGWSKSNLQAYVRRGYEQPRYGFFAVADSLNARNPTIYSMNSTGGGSAS